MGGDTTSRGSAERWGPLWGARPRDWASIEQRQRPTYEEAIRRVGIEAGDRVLDVGCGTGAFLRLAADHAAEVFGVDASSALLDVARELVPEADLRIGDMEDLPFGDDSFDLVTGFNSFFFAADMVAALREAGRVAKPGAPVLIQVWGEPERNDLEPTKEVARAYAPPPSGEMQPAPPPFWQPGVLESIASEAGLAPGDSFTLRYAFEYEDAETLGRELMAPMGLAELVGPDHEDEVRARIVDVLAPCRQPDGSYRIENEYRYLIAVNG